MKRQSRERSADHLVSRIEAAFGLRLRLRPRLLLPPSLTFAPAPEAFFLLLLVLPRGGGITRERFEVRRRNGDVVSPLGDGSAARCVPAAAAGNTAARSEASSGRSHAEAEASSSASSELLPAAPPSIRITMNAALQSQMVWCHDGERAALSPSAKTDASAATQTPSSTAAPPPPPPPPPLPPPPTHPPGASGGAGRPRDQAPRAPR